MIDLQASLKTHLANTSYEVEQEYDNPDFDELYQKARTKYEAIVEDLEDNKGAFIASLMEKANITRASAEKVADDLINKATEHINAQSEEFISEFKLEHKSKRTVEINLSDYSDTVDLLITDAKINESVSKIYAELEAQITARNEGVY